MARGTRKPASDSLTGLLAAARGPDLSAASAPRTVPGVDGLNDAGLSAYDALFRQRPSWSLGDLILVVQASKALQQIAKLDAVLDQEGMIIVTPTGVTKTHPALNMIEVLMLRVRNCLRDCGLRLKDKQLPSASMPPPIDITPTKGGESIMSVVESLLRQ